MKERALIIDSEYTPLSVETIEKLERITSNKVKEIQPVIVDEDDGLFDNLEDKSGYKYKLIICNEYDASWIEIYVIKHFMCEGSQHDLFECYIWFKETAGSCGFLDEEGVLEYVQAIKKAYLQEGGDEVVKRLKEVSAEGYTTIEDVKEELEC